MISSKIDNSWTEWSGITEYNVLLEKKYESFILYTPNVQSYVIKDKLEPVIDNDFIKQVYVCRDHDGIYCLLAMMVKLDGSKYFQIMYDDYAFLIILE